MGDLRRKAIINRLRQEVPLSPMSYPRLSGYKSAYVESDTDISSRSNSPTIADSTRRTSSTDGIASSDDASSPISERAKRARRRASSGYEADSGGDTKHTILSNSSRVSKTTRRTSRTGESLLRQASNVETRAQRRKRELVGSSSSSENEPVLKSSLLRRRNAPGFPSRKVNFTDAVNNALEDMRAAEVEPSPYSRRHSISPTVENNIFARQASLSNLSPTSSIPTPSPLKSTKFANHRSPTEKHLSSRYNWGESSPVDEPVNPKSSLAHFARRLSAHAQALRRKDYDTPDSEESDTKHGSPPKVGDISTLSAVQTSLASMLEEMITGIAQKHRDRNAADNKSEKPSWDDEDRLRTDYQRLATLIATQPPTAPAPDQSGRELKDFYRVAEALVLQGTQGAHQVYQNAFRRGQLPTQEELMKLVVDSAGNYVAPRDKWLIIQHQERPDLFFSTVSWADKYWHRDPTKRLTGTEMMHVLLADEVRYRQAWKSCALLRLLPQEPRKPRLEQSSYPYYNMREKEHALQQQQVSSAPNVIYLKAHVGNQSGGVQSIVLEQDLRSRQPSWKMDVDVNDGGNARAHNDHTWRPGHGFNFAAATFRDWQPSRGVSFKPLPRLNNPQKGSQNKNLCPHHLKGHCKFGTNCKKSHDTSDGNATSGQVSDQAKKANDLLNELYAYLHAVDQASPGDFRYGDDVDGMARGVASRIDALCSVATFTNGHDLVQTNFKDPRVHATVPNFQITWKMLLGDQIMPTILSESLDHLDRTISQARQRLAQVQMVPTGTNFSNDNAFQSGGNNQQNNKNVSNQNGGGNNNKGGKDGNNKNDKKNNNQNNIKDNTRNGKNNKDGNSVKKSGNQFNANTLGKALITQILAGDNEKSQNTNQNKKGKGKGKGRGNGGGRRGK